MQVGDPVRANRAEVVCVLSRVCEGFAKTTCLWRASVAAWLHTVRAATHREDGTAFDLCAVCWPNGMPSGEEG